MWSSKFFKKCDSKKELGIHLTPISLLQERWFRLSYMGFGHINSLVLIRGPIVVDVFYKALELICKRHDVLHSIYEPGSPPRQRLLIDFHPEFQYFDFRKMDSVEKTKELQDALNRSLVNFNILNEVPFSVELLQFEEELTFFVGRKHHIASDGWSNAIFFENLEKIYLMLERGENIENLSFPPQYSSYAIEQRDYFSSRDFFEERYHWQNLFAGCNAITRMPAINVEDKEDNLAQFVSAILTVNEVKQLQFYAKTNRGTLFSVLLAGFVKLLNEITGEKDLVFGTSWAGRHHLQANQTLGVFVNPLPMRINLNTGDNFDDIFKIVKEQLLETSEHQEYTIFDLIQSVKPFIDRPIHAPWYIHLLYQSFPPPKKVGVRSYQNIDFQDRSLKTPFGIVPPQERLMFEIEPVIHQHEKGDIAISFGFTSRFDEKHIKIWLSRYMEILRERSNIK